MQPRQFTKSRSDSRPRPHRHAATLAAKCAVPQVSRKEAAALLAAAAEVASARTALLTTRSRPGALQASLAEAALKEQLLISERRVWNQPETPLNTMRRCCASTERNPLLKMRTERIRSSCAPSILASIQHPSPGRLPRTRRSRLLAFPSGLP